MTRCHNCGRETLRTEDWACQWCGHPLPFGPFKKIDKTFRQLKEERLGRSAIETESTRQLKTKLAAEEAVVVKQDLEAIKKIKLEPEPRFKRDDVINEVKPELTQDEKVKEPEECEPESATEMLKKNDIKETKEDKSGSEVEVEAEKEIEEKAEAVKGAEDKDISGEELEIEKIQKHEPEPESADIELNVGDIIKEYERDDAAADEMFMNKILRVTGIVSLIDIKDKLDIHYIRITGSDTDPWQNLQCMFDKKYASVLEELERGQTVTVQGRYSGSIIAIRMVNCVLIN